MMPNGARRRRPQPRPRQPTEKGALVPQRGPSLEKPGVTGTEMRYGANIEGPIESLWTEGADKKFAQIVFVCSTWTKYL